MGEYFNNEYFDLVFFVADADNNKKRNRARNRSRLKKLLNTPTCINQFSEHPFSLLAGKKVVVDSYPETNFVGYFVGVHDMVITKSNFNNKLTQMLEVVSACFERLSGIMFATGMYQTTLTYTKGIKCVSGFTKSVLSNFPFLFFRKGGEYGFVPTHTYENVSYVVQFREHVQDVFDIPMWEWSKEDRKIFEETLRQHPSE